MFQSEYATIFHADSMLLMPEMIKGSFMADCIVCDPPYLLTSGGCTKGGLHERFGRDPDSKYGNSGNLFDGDCPAWADFMPLIFDCLKSPAHCYLMADSKNQFEMQSAALDAGFRFHNLLYWDKGTCTPNRWYMKNAEYIGLFFKGSAIPINDCSSKQGLYVPHVDETAHPTEKPVALMQHYIENSSKIGDVIFDPFCGTGSTGVAALKSNRRFFGIERDERWFNVACERIKKAQIQHQISLF